MRSFTIISVNREKPIRRLGTLLWGALTRPRLCYKRTCGEGTTNSIVLLIDREKLVQLLEERRDRSQWRMACSKLYTILLLAVIIGIVAGKPGYLGGYGLGGYYPYLYSYKYPSYGYGHGYGYYGYPHFGYGHGFGHYGGYY